MDYFEYLHSVSSEPEQTRTGCDGGVLNFKLKLASLTHDICKIVINFSLRATVPDDKS